MNTERGQTRPPRKVEPELRAEGRTWTRQQLPQWLQQETALVGERR